MRNLKHPEALPASRLRIASVLGGAFLLALSSATAVAADRVDAAIIFLVDVSGSMDAGELALARRSHADAMASADVLGAIADGETGRVAVAYIEYADRANVRIDWTVVDGTETAKAFGDAVLDDRGPGSGGMTGLGIALLAADKLAGSLPYDATRLVVDIVGDGVSNFGPSTRLGREALLSRGAVINTMPVMRNPACTCIDRYFAIEIAGGPGHFTLPIAAVAEMPTALRSKIVLELF